MLLTFRSFISFLRLSLLVQNPGICAIIIQLAGMKSSDEREISEGVTRHRARV